MKAGLVFDMSVGGLCTIVVVAELLLLLLVGGSTDGNMLLLLVPVVQRNIVCGLPVAVAMAIATCCLCWASTLAHPSHGARVVAFGGVTGAGKTTLSLSLQRLCGTIAVVHADSHRLAAQDCPQFDIADGIPWPKRRIPKAFSARGTADRNVPSSLDWQALHDEVAATAKRGVPVIVEGHLLYSSHPGAARVLSLCDEFVVLAADAEDDEVMKTLWRRKWQRAHLGKRSYRELGVGADEYKAYWTSYVWPRWLEHGRTSIPGRALCIDSMMPMEQKLSTLQQTGWFGCCGPCDNCDTSHDHESSARRTGSEFD